MLIKLYVKTSQYTIEKHTLHLRSLLQIFIIFFKPTRNDKTEAILRTDEMQHLF